MMIALTDFGRSELNAAHRRGRLETADQALYYLVPHIIHWHGEPLAMEILRDVLQDVMASDTTGWAMAATTLAARLDIALAFLMRRGIVMGVEV